MIQPRIAVIASALTNVHTASKTSIMALTPFVFHYFRKLVELINEKKCPLNEEQVPRFTLSIRINPTKPSHIGSTALRIGRPL